MRTPALLSRLMGFGIAMLMIVPVLVFGYVSRENVLDALAERAAEERERSATAAGQVVDEALRAAVADLRSIAARSSLREALTRRDGSALTRHVQDLKSAAPRYNSAGIFDLKGVMLAREPEGGVIGQSFADVDYFINALVSPGPYVSESYLSRADPPKPLVAVSLRVAEGASTLGVIEVTFATEAFFALLQGLGGVEGREILILDKRSQVIASSATRRSLEILNVPRTSGRAKASVGGEDRIVTSVPIANADWTVYTLDDPAIALAIETRLESVMITTFVANLLVVLLVGLAGSWMWAQRASSAEVSAKGLELHRRANEELRVVDQRKNEFVSIVSHEFRTPLTGILGFSEMIRDEGLSVEEMKEFAGDINKDARRLGRMINDMLDLDRLQSGGMELSLTSVDLNEIAREVTDLVRPNAPGHQIEVTLDAGMPAIEGDHDRLTQVVTNLLNNAVKYSPEGGRILVRTAFTDGRAGLTVTDSGIGMPADSLERIFEKFTRVESREMRDIQGTGLGLPIVRQIVEMHGGRVWAESEPGKGSTFHVSLPRVGSLERVPVAAPA